MLSLWLKVVWVVVHSSGTASRTATLFFFFCFVLIIIRLLYYFDQLHYTLSILVWLLVVNLRMRRSHRPLATRNCTQSGSDGERAKVTYLVGQFLLPSTSSLSLSL